MVKKADHPKHLIETALRLAAERGWHDLSLAEIAEAAGLPLGKAYQVFSSKQAILEGFARGIDAEVLADETMEQDWGQDESSARDRLFDVMMRRFDALQPYKAGLGNILYDQARDPLAALCGLQQLLRSMAAMLEAARISSSGVKGLIRTKGLAAIYLATLRIWLRDDSPDMAKTMASLDGHLRRVEALAGRLGGRRAAAGESPGEPPL
jgi:AcrR family transcriptional regulator